MLPDLTIWEWSDRQLNPRDLPKDGNMSWQVTTPPAVEPITVDEVKFFARIDATTEDTLLAGFITAARENCERYLGRSLVNQTITARMDFWPGKVIELPRPPLVSVTSIEVIDEELNAVIYDSSNYYIVTEAIPGQLVIKNSTTNPYQSFFRTCGGFRIIYIAGYGAAATNVPQGIK